jgi:hypothetical protein
MEDRYSRPRWIAAAGVVVACSDDPTGPQSTTYVAQMRGANEVPAVAGGASGTATFTLTGKTLSYMVTVNGLSGNAAASHIHFGAAGSNGGIVYPFSAAAVQSGQVASGLIDLTLPISNGTTSISGDSLLTLLNGGLLYQRAHRREPRRRDPRANYPLSVFQRLLITRASRSVEVDQSAT